MAVCRNQLLVLRYLAGCSQPVAGIDVSTNLDWVATSSIYAAISALQAQGLIVAEWDHSQSHPRRMISLNKAGTSAIQKIDDLEARMAQFSRFQEAKR